MLEAVGLIIRWMRIETGMTRLVFEYRKFKLKPSDQDALLQSKPIARYIDVQRA